MKNMLRFALFLVFCYAGFALSAAIYSFLDALFATFSSGTSMALAANVVPTLPGWIICGIMLNLCVRSRVAVPAPTLALFWLVAIGPFVLLWLNARGTLVLSLSALFADPMPLVLQCCAFVASFLSVNRLANR
ncbi:MAG: hypothetical protein Q4C56_03445 [Peptococcaceae bacterium]|nr:hypothetical protein [Peptococcaceae bacterium]